MNIGKSNTMLPPGRSYQLTTITQPETFALT
jgi:hypothetical protein